MPDLTPDPSKEDRPLRLERREWQFWSFLVLGVVILGIGIAVYEVLRAPATAWSIQEISQLIPAMLFGVIALLVLVNFYLAQKDAVIRGLQHELVQQKIEAELNRELALQDPVTEVYNRRYLRVMLSKEISRVKRMGKSLAVMLVDITGFRRVNESLGHTGGDVVLRQIAQLLQSKLRNSDLVVRFGGDEFLLILPDTDDAGVQILSARMKESLGDWSRRSGMTEFNLRFAIGSARYTQDRPLDDLLKSAEQRLQHDRRTGGEPPAAAGTGAAAAAMPR
ncbi:MAG TPA: GGDEF domain-containing protein [Patescibacteria group bacterium]|nr:GGDEF domain-containing protein [Patescibacteria group bacterium]